jgi:hypothetical protein
MMTLKVIPLGEPYMFLANYNPAAYEKRFTKYARIATCKNQNNFIGLSNQK